MNPIWLFFAGAALCAIVRRWYPKEASWLGTAICLAGVLMGLRLVMEQAIGLNTLVDAWLGEYAIEAALYFDPLSTLMLTVVATVGLVAAIAAQARRAYELTPLLLLALGAGAGAVLAGEIPTFYVFSLLLSLCLALALGLKGERRSAAQFFVTVEGTGVLLLIAAIYIDIGVGSSRFSALIGNSSLSALPAGGWALVGVIAAIVARSAWVPAHTWLTRASRGLSAASATWMLVLPPLVGLYLLLRSWPWLLLIDADWLVPVVQGLGAATVLLGSYAALHQRSFRRVAAFVVLAQAGFIPLGLDTFTVQGSDAALYHLVSFGLVAPLTFLALGRLSEALRQQEPQEPVSFILALIGILAAIAAPATQGFLGRFVLVQSLLARPGDSLLFLLVYWLGTAFITLALMGVLHRLVQRGVSLGEVRGQLEDALFQPAALALAVPVLIVLLLGISHSFWQGFMLAAASGISELSAEAVLTVRGAAWTVLVTLAGPGLGLLLYLANKESATWKWKILGIQQSAVVAPESWWSYLEQADPYQAVRLLVLGLADEAADIMDIFAGRLAR